MKLSLKIFCLFFFVAACIPKSDKTHYVSEQDNDSLTYAVINLVLTDTSLYGKVLDKILSETPRLLPNNYDGTYVSYVSKILSESDTICVEGQMRRAKKFTTIGMLSYGFEVINLDEFESTFAKNDRFWDRFHEKFGDGFYSVSKPIFNCDCTKVFIMVGHLCGGKCGGGTEIVLENVNGSWILNEKLSSWIS